MKLIFIVLLFASLPILADEYGYRNPSIADTLVTNRINQLQQQMDYNSPLNQQLKMQRESNDIASEQLDYERSRDHEMEYRRAIGAN